MNLRNVRAAGIVLFTVALLAVTAACSGDDLVPNVTNTPPGGDTTAPTGNGDGGANAAGNACDLLTNDEASGVFGPVGAGQLTSDPPETTCYWQSSSPGSGDDVQIVLYAGASDQEAQTFFDNFGGEAVSGLGDQAKWVASAYLLEVLKGADVIEVTIFSDAITNDADQLSASKTIAQDAIARVSGDAAFRESGVPGEGSEPAAA